MSESDCDKHTTIRASSAPLGKKDGTLAVCHGDSAKGEGGATIDFSRPFIVPENEKFNLEKFREWSLLRAEWVAKSIPNNIIIPDPTPKRVCDAFRGIAPRLELILKKDSVRCFLRLFESNEGMHWDLTITAETLTYVVIHNALRCARVVLKGKAPQLHGMHANPNGMNPYGYFPLHEAAKRFSVDMIKLPFRHGASANVRTVGNKVIENLLPLHVAVENACLHKYLEDNLSPRRDCQDYTYNLIHLLCLPEMVPHLEVLEHVSSFLMSFGFFPTGEGIDVKNFCPYDCKISDRESHDKEATKAITEIARAAGGKVVRKKPKGWDPEYTRGMFFPYWRSVLLARCPLRVYPSYVPAPTSEVDPEVFHHSWNGSMSNGSTQNPNPNLELVGRINQPASNLQP